MLNREEGAYEFTERKNARTGTSASGESLSRLSGLAAAAQATRSPPLSREKFGSTLERSCLYLG